MIPKERDIPNFWSDDGAPVPVSHLIFDLDNTLYPSSSSLAAEMHERMTGFVAEHLGLPHEAAQALRQEGFRKHGTTLRWLQLEAGLSEPDSFLDYVHPENLCDLLPPAPDLRRLLDSLALPKSILTNAPRNHALRVLRHYGIEDCFGQVFDLQWNRYEGKPHRSAYERPLSALGLGANEAVFIDDVPDYLATFAAMGGNCVLVDESDAHAGGLAFPAAGRLAVVRSVFGLPSVIY
jgi:putative hydrolase of the HAD superfamily